MLGVTPLAGRLTSALVGTITVALLYRLGRELFGPDSWAPLVSATILTLTLFHLILSRIGLRAISLAPVAITSLLFLWDAYRVGRWRSFILRGGFLGLSLYTYTAARLVILVPVIVMVVAIVARWPLPSRVWHKSAAAALAGAVIAAPLIIFAIQNPSSVLAHGASLAMPISDLFPNFYAVARMFTLEGDVDLLHNLPGRPIYTGAMSLLFYAGLLTAVGALFEPLRKRLRFPATWVAPAVLTLAWFIAMTLPTILSESAPDFLRSLSLAPAIALIGGFGAETVRRLWSHSSRLPLLSLIVVLRTA